VRHPNGVTTYYAHLSTARVQKGDKVTVDTELGTVGNTGNASHTFPHLHFQVWKDGQIQDPANFFSVPAYTNLSPQEKMRGPWLSEQAREEAEAFNMREHLSQRRVAFTRDVDKLVKVADQYYRLTKS
jgi:murein DD-endopeptidase MepM/ murein hydrolase activator NlpD